MTQKAGNIGTEKQTAGEFCSEHENKHGMYLGRFAYFFGPGIFLKTGRFRGNCTGSCIAKQRIEIQLVKYENRRLMKHLRNQAIVWIQEALEIPHGPLSRATALRQRGFMS